MLSFLYRRSTSELVLQYLLLAGFLVSVAAMSWTFSLLSSSRTAAEDSTNEVLRTHQVLILCGELEADVMTFESAARGFLILSEDELDTPYAEAVVSARNKVTRLTELVKEDSAQVRTARRLASLVKDRIAFADRQVQLAREGNFTRARNLTKSGVGVRLTRFIVSQINLIKSRQTEKLRSRIAQNNRQQAKVSRYSATLGWTTAGVIFICAVAAGQTLRQRKKAEVRAKDAARYVKSVLDNISEGVLVINEQRELELCNPTAERLLGAECAYLKHANSESFGFYDPVTKKTIDLYETLTTGEGQQNAAGHKELLLVNPEAPSGTLVSAAARTLEGEKWKTTVIVLFDLTQEKEAREELMKVNKELDAFCYSISHDLRAPLRSITGFSQILMEDYGKRLDDEALRICHVIVRAAEKMGRLIDDLLKFSRVNRHDVSPATVPLDEMTKEIVQKIETENGGLKHTFNISPVPPVCADPQLLQQVMVNLLSNAVKYSSRREKPVVELGHKEEAGETVYFIKDNGEGFDMRYYDKLFEVFQRLHSEQEFEGTGVGLSIVKRIIDRHGGRVWAESTPGEGATFYFTIPEISINNNEHDNQLH